MYLYVCMYYVLHIPPHLNLPHLTLPYLTYHLLNLNASICDGK